MAHVRSVPRSVDFYRKLGFEVGNTFTPDSSSEPAWAWLRSNDAHLMVSKADGPFDDQVLALHQRPLRGRMTEPVGRTGRPVRLDRRAELVFRPDDRIGDRLPQALGRGADVDLEDLLHLILQLVLQAGEPGSPRLGVLADPPVVD